VHGEVLDIGRVEYLRACLEQLVKASQDGCRLQGYFVWSLMDNFEWGFGYSKRFGIVQVNYTTMERTPKLSAHYFSAVIRENRVL
jgi:beta-glucosidase